MSPEPTELEIVLRNEVVYAEIQKVVRENPERVASQLRKHVDTLRAHGYEPLLWEGIKRTEVLLFAKARYTERDHRGRFTSRSEALAVRRAGPATLPWRHRGAVHPNLRS